MRLLMPYAMRKLAERMMKKAQSHQYTYGGQSPFGNANPFGAGYQDNAQESGKTTGKLHVDYMPTKEEHKKKGAATAGEFVDFEEIK